MYTNINTLNYVLQPGSLFYHNGTTCSGLPSNTTSDKLTAYDSSGFLYVNPFLTIVNKSPFFVEYYLNILNYSKTLNFEYINSASELQFVSATGSVSLKRLYFTDRNIYKLTFSITQNINTDFGIVVTDDSGNIKSSTIKAMAVIYVNNTAYRYMNAILTSYDDSSYVYSFEVDFTTSDIIDNNGNIYIEHGVYNLGTTEELATYLSSNITVKLYILAKFDTNYGNGDATSICPGLTDYTLCNIYSINNGIDLYYDYTNIMSSYVNLQKNSDNSYSHVIEKMPLIRYTYLNSESRMTNFIKTLEKRRLWIQACLVLLESLKTFFKFKSKIEIKDLGRYPSIQDLWEVTDAFAGETETLSKSQTEKIIKKDTKKLIDTPDFKVYVPETKEAACYYGKGTKWCTAADNDNMFDHYNNQGKLYVIMAGTGENIKKFQLHFESEQFMNDKDAEITKAQIKYLSGFPKYKEFLEMLIEEHYGDALKAYDKLKAEGKIK
jgi:hypothetical protein